MNREDIIEMAREASLIAAADQFSILPFLERFAALVAAAEREACAKVCELKQHSEYDGYAECAAAIRARGQA